MKLALGNLPEWAQPWDYCNLHVFLWMNLRRGIKRWLFPLCSYNFIFQKYSGRGGEWWQPLICLFSVLSTAPFRSPILDGLLVFLPHNEEVNGWRLFYSAVPKLCLLTNLAFFWEELLLFFFFIQICLNNNSKNAFSFIYLRGSRSVQTIRLLT